MRFDFLPQRYIRALSNCKTDKLYEIRLRNGFQVLVNVDNKKMFLSDSGFTILENNAIICAQNDINAIIRNVTEFSTYAFNDKIKRGFLTTQDGIRIGLAGECVYDKEEIITIKNISSLNIRVPHEISGCAEEIVKFSVVGKRVSNTLLISPPFFGKTTILKDFARQIDAMDIGSILIIDERGEFSCVKGRNIDSIKYSDKLYAFEYGLRVLSPKIIITDELSGEKDWQCVKKAVCSGVNIVASCHGYDISDLKMKNNFSNGIFERYFLLGNQSKCRLVYDEEFNVL